MCTGLRWSLMDTQSKKEVEEVRGNVELILQCYPDLKELEYGQWQELLQKYFWHLVNQA